MKKENSHTSDPLLHAFSNGDEKGFSLVFTAYYPSLCYFAMRFTKEKEIAEDIVQNCFIKLWARRANFKSLPQVRAYIYKIVRFACLDYLKESQKEELSGISEIVEENVLHQLIRTETWRQLYSLIDGLPPGVSRVIKMLYIEGKSIKETADELQKSVHTIKSHRARGISLLRSRHTGFYLILLQIVTAIFRIN